MVDEFVRQLLDSRSCRGVGHCGLVRALMTAVLIC
jgi:hypothetical protein